MKNNQIGRSMIEMLGVLAIIAVLSVGGIAGYGKAMRMWQANIQKQMIEELLHSMIEVRSQFQEREEEIEVTPILAAMGHTPEGAVFDGRYFIDKKGNKMKVIYGVPTYQNPDGTSYKGSFLYALHFFSFTSKAKILDLSLQDYCVSLVEAAKSMGDEFIYTYYGTHGENGRMYELFTYNSLKKATLSDIQSKCRITLAEKETGFSHFTTHIKPY